MAPTRELPGNHDSTNSDDVPSFTWRTAVSAMPFLSDLYPADLSWIHLKSSHHSEKTSKIAMYIDLEHSLRGFLCVISAWITLNPLCGQILNKHDRIPNPSLTV